jgi:hypothetical protein
MSKGQIHHILRNPIYIGKIKHKDMVYEGQHDAIIEGTLWESVQDKLQAASSRRRGHLKDAHQLKAPLLGKVIDETGDHLTPTHTKKNGRILRYYISNRLIKQKDPSGWRLPARPFEAAVADAVKTHLYECHQSLSLFDANDASDIKARHAKVDLNKLQQSHLLNGVKCAYLKKGQIKVELRGDVIPECIHIIPQPLSLTAQTFIAPFTINRRSNQTKVIIGSRIPSPNPSLLFALKSARFALAELRKGKSLSDIAIQSQVDVRHIRKTIRMGLLSTRIQKAILSGDHPNNWSCSTFTRSVLPMDWDTQETMFLE